MSTTFYPPDKKKKKYCSHFTSGCENIRQFSGARVDIFETVGQPEVQWDLVGENGKSCLGEALPSSSGFDTLQLCLQACEKADNCKSITYFEDTWCNHFSTSCTKENTMQDPKAVSFTSTSI